MSENGSPGRTGPGLTTEASQADARLLNARAWELRWTNRAVSKALAGQVLQFTSENSRGEIASVGLAYRTLAWHARWQGDFDTCQTYCDRAHDRLAKVECYDDLAIVAVSRGMVSYCRGQRAEAHRYLSQATSLLGPESRPDARVTMLGFAIAMAQSAGATDREADLITEALALTRGGCRALIEHRRVRGMLLRNESEAALPYALEALATTRRLGNEVILPFALEITGACYRMAGSFDLADAYLGEAMAAARASDDRRAECHVLQQQGLMLEARRAGEQALVLSHRGLSLARHIGYPIWEKVLLRQIAEIHERAGHTDKALVAYKELANLQSPDMR